MYNSQDVVKNIKLVAKEQGKAVGKMLEDCGLSKNALSSMQSGYLPRTENLCKIADYLNVSVDYLLGRTDNPEIITGNNINIGNNSLNINTNSTTNEISELFDSLTLVQRAKVIVMIDEMKKGE